VLGTGSVIVDDTPGALSDYVSSLERLLTLQPRTIHPGHGPVVADARGKLQEYLAHRQQREQQVISALLAAGSATVEDLVAAIYTDLAPNLAPMAAQNVRACLDKLNSERRVVKSGPTWRLTS